MWRPLSTAPLDRLVRLVVIDAGTVHALEFPCRRRPDGTWINATTDEPLEVPPTAWAEWQDTP